MEDRNDTGPRQAPHDPFKPRFGSYPEQRGELLRAPLHPNQTRRPAPPSPALKRALDLAKSGGSMGRPGAHPLNAAMQPQGSVIDAEEDQTAPPEPVAAPAEVALPSPGQGAPGVSSMAAFAALPATTDAPAEAAAEDVGAAQPDAEQVMGMIQREALLSGASMQEVDAAIQPLDVDRGEAEEAEYPANRLERRAYPAIHDGARAPSGRPLAPPLTLGATSPAGTSAAVAVAGEARDLVGAPGPRNLVMMGLDWFADVIHQPDDPVLGPLEPGMIGMLIGLPGASKSTIAIHMAVATAAGCPFAGLQVPGPQKVVVFSPEDAAKEIGRRLFAACGELGADEALVRQNLRVASFKRGGPLLEKAANGQELTDNGAELRDAIRDHGARLVFVDPLVEMHAAQESDNGEMHAVFSAFRDLAHNNKCAILITHHVTKDSKGNLSMFNGRGAGSMAGAVRVMFGAEELPAAAADKVVPLHPGSTARDFLNFSMLKANYEKVPGTSVTLMRVDNVVGAGNAPSLRALSR